MGDVGGGRFAYDLEPTCVVAGHDGEAFEGADVGRVLGQVAAGVRVVVADCYPGVTDEVLALLEDAVQPDVVVRSDEAFMQGAALEELLEPYLTDDRVRGYMYGGGLRDLVDAEALDALVNRVCDARERGLRVLVYGVGA